MDFSHRALTKTAPREAIAQLCAENMQRQQHPPSLLLYNQIVIFTPESSKQRCSAAQSAFFALTVIFISSFRKGHIALSSPAWIALIPWLGAPSSLMQKQTDTLFLLKQDHHETVLFFFSQPGINTFPNTNHKI